VKFFSLFLHFFAKKFLNLKKRRNFAPLCAKKQAVENFAKSFIHNLFQIKI